MEVRTLGRLAALGCASCDEGPPSSQSILALYRGEPGALMRVVGSTALRAVLIAPGVFVGARWAGARGGKLAAATIGGSLVSAAGITAFLAIYYAWKGRANGGAQVVGGPPQLPGNAPDVEMQQALAQQAQTANPAALVPEATQRAVDMAFAAQAGADEVRVAALHQGAQRMTGFMASSFGSKPW